LTNIKGVDILLAAIPAVLKEIPNLKVCIAGNGEEKQNLENLTKKLHITDNVRFLGFIAEEDKHRMYRSCKICVVPSRWDCQPISILEAIAFGKPVIASTASNPEVLEIGKCGLLFNSEDSNDLADKIKILLGDKNLRQDLGRNGKKISKDYDWDVIASKFFDIYRGEILSYTMKINKES
jgi:phosphatidylinositol alpha-mannosyltransferase